jgi:CheY-like chemotaxis protein
MAEDGPMISCTERLILLALPDRALVDALVDELGEGSGTRGLAVDGAEAALAWARELRPSLVLTSLHLPGVESLIAALRADAGPRPSIVALRRPSDRGASRPPAGYDDLLEEPIGAAALADYLSRAVALPRRPAGAFTRS